eukprot:UN07235
MEEVVAMYLNMPRIQLLNSTIRSPYSRLCYNLT